MWPRPKILRRWSIMLEARPKCLKLEPVVEEKYCQLCEAEGQSLRQLRGEIDLSNWSIACSSNSEQRVKHHLLKNYCSFIDDRPTVGANSTMPSKVPKDAAFEFFEEG